MNIQHHTYRPVTVSSLFTAHNLQAENYAFASKERDTETGLSVTSLRSVSSLPLGHFRTSSNGTRWLRRFGARYYSSELSVWLSVDPMVDKYPSFSPYVYCADNPVKLVDPNGEEIYVGDNYYYRNGCLYDKSTGELFTPDADSFEGKALNSLNKLRGTKQGSELMNPFEGETGSDAYIKDAANNLHDPDNVEINDEVFSESGAFQSASIYWNPDGKRLFKTLDPNSVADLGHEFSHMYDKATNRHYKSGNIDNCPRNEWQAVYRENNIRGELGVKYRPGYKVILQYKDGTRLPYVTKMLNNGYPFLPSNF